VRNSSGKQVGTLRRAGPSTNHLLVTGLTRGRTYQFRVRAVSQASKSVWSSIASTRLRR
jgi:hypothetical protein